MPLLVDEPLVAQALASGAGFVALEHGADQADEVAALFPSPVELIRDLAGHPQVYETIRKHVEEVNASVAQDPMLSGCQIHRFLILHKELDADDGEMTRTRKVKRGVIAEKYADLIAALYDGRTSVYTETEVTYEDGRKGRLKATLRIEDAKVFSTATPTPAQRMAAE